MSVLFDKLICDDEDCGGPLDVNGVCLDCGRECDGPVSSADNIVPSDVLCQRADGGLDAYSPDGTLKGRIS